jgi:hypothetical protein
MSVLGLGDIEFYFLGNIMKSLGIGRIIICSTTFDMGNGELLIFLVY